MFRRCVTVSKTLILSNTKLLTWASDRGIYTITNVTPDYAEITTKGIPYGFDNRTGKWGIWNLSLFLDGAKFKARQSEVFMNISDTDNNMCETSTFIMLKMILNYINPKVYQFDYLDPINLTVTKELCEPGTSTHSTVTKLIHSDTGELLVERLAKLCRVDNETHRPVKWSPQFHQMFSHLKDRGMPKVLKKTSTPIPTSPPDCFKWTFKSRYSDMDVKMHANQSMYIKSCIDCATEASMNGQLDQFNGDIIWYPVKYLSINYIAETFANDTLTVNMWQHNKDVSILYFSVWSDALKKIVTFIEVKIDLNKIK
ncbi:Hypothetical predicted protein [Mytilus galloprovincialis]|uniref:Uncharacterized protein n=2 Tax=Mytilus galloprovincialis TaxID=29158 RepID=A0A8B6CL02_MYTGA|nr:Hypothetical predicted protein [Mytilus galloprovincialis]